MEISTYQSEARTTAIYPKEAAITYPLLGLIGEVGEFANKYKKVIRDGREFSQDDMVSELGDILWYISNLCTDADISLNHVAISNLRKLGDRAERGVLSGSGDQR